VALTPCPECGLELEELDLLHQVQHMEAQHPEVCEERRREAARWDGWEDE
jgi:transcription initiation factor IIE alpha subunit